MRNRFNILIFGCGNIGFRHFQGLLKNNQDMNIYLYDTNNKYKKKFIDELTAAGLTFSTDPKKNSKAVEKRTTKYSGPFSTGGGINSRFVLSGKFPHGYDVSFHVWRFCPSYLYV